jgi:lysozyme family protein
VSEHFESSLSWVLAQEGGFAKLAQDETTNLGVKQSTWEDWIKKKVSEQDMKKLTVGDVAPLYRKNYYEAAHCPQIAYPLSLAVFDFAVNSGVGRSLQVLSYLAGISLDTKMHGKLIEYVNEHPNPKAFVLQYLDARKNFLRTLRNYTLYGNGWEKRVMRLQVHIIDLLDHPQSIPAN